MRTIGRIFVDAHRQALDLLLRQSAAVLIVAAGLLAASLAENLLHPLVTNAMAQLVLDWLLHATSLWVTAPAVVAIFRHLILGESADPHPLHRNPVIGAYFKAAVTLSLITVIPTLIRSVAHGGAEPGIGGLGQTLGTLTALWFLLTRITTYLPGIAVGRSSRSAALAFKETQGHFLFISACYFAALAPTFIVTLGLAALFHGRAPWQISILLFIPGSALLVIGTCVSALLYQHLKRDEVPDATGPARPAAAPQGPRRTFGRLAYQPSGFAADDTGGLGSANQVTVAGISRAAYGDLVNIVREMWPVLLILSALYFVCAMAWFIAPIFVNAWVGRMVVRMLIFIGIAWVATPYYVALHRFVSTGDVQWIPPRESYGRASAVYFGWSGLTVTLWFMPLILGNTVDAFSPSLAVLTDLAAMVIVFIVLVRMTTLLPAAALVADRASWAHAMEDSRGRFWLFALSTTGAALPAIIVLFVIGRAAGSQTISALPFFALAVPVLLVMQLVPLAAGTRLYERLPRESAIPRMQQVIRPR